MNTSKIKCIITYIVIIMCLPCGSIYGWGFFAHKWINKTAVNCLPAEIRPFFAKHIKYLTEHSVDPDLWRKHDPDEAVRHYIDIDMYGDYPFKELPRSFQAAKKKFGEKIVTERGIAPWWVVKRFEQLVEAMKQGEPDSIIAQSAALSHYVADLHMPLHTVENYNGQLTGNDGIHFRFEAWMLEAFARDMKLKIKKAKSIGDPLSFIFNVVLDSYLLAGKIIQADSKAKNPKKEYKEREDYDQEYITALFKSVGSMAENQMSAAATNIASFWYSAWIKAGKPDLMNNKS